MASGIFAILDDVATLLDDAAVLSKVAAKKTAGLLGDDLAVNAEKATGFHASRELPVIWAITKGSLLNKLIILPVAFLLSAYLPWLIVPILLVGGAYLSYEGVEKVLEWFGAHDTHEVAAAHEELTPEQVLQREAGKIKGAVRTDFILSAEIIAITLGTVAGQPFWTQLIVLAGIAVVMTIGVYGLVGGIVKLDDLGLWLSRRASSAAQALGRGILWLAPWLMKFLSVAGTAAMFLVGGGIIAHGLPWLHHLLEGWTHGMAGWGATLTGMAFNAGVGLVAGAALVAVFSLVQRLRGGKGH